MSLFDWHNCSDFMPFKSGIYTVRDRKGRVFDTWFEKGINGFNHVHEGTGYTIIEWRFVDG